MRSHLVDSASDGTQPLGDRNSPHARDLAYNVHPYTHLRRHLQAGPLVIVRGEGVRVFDDTGRSYIEGMAGLWCAGLGWAQPRLVEAGAKALRDLAFYHGFSGKTALPTIDLAERLIALSPVPMSKVLFANSGSEANDTAIKLIWYVNNALGRPGKKKIISRRRAYHGVTVATASLTGLPANHSHFDLPIDRVYHVSCPHYWREAQPGEDEAAFVARLADELDALIVAEGPNTVAAFFAEPVMGAGGVIVPPEGYFPAVQAVLRRHDVLLVADEVICGFGRTGNRWGSETCGLSPDIITCAKGLSSGYLPISATLISEAIWHGMLDASDVIGLFAHGYTYSGHPVAASVALEALALYDDLDIIEHVRAVAPVLQEGLARFSGHPLVGEVRGVGLVAAAELVQDPDAKKSFPAAAGVGPYLVRAAERHGLIIRSLTGDVIAFSPPLIITEAEIEEMLAAYGRALDETWAWVQSEGLAPK